MAEQLLVSLSLIILWQTSQIAANCFCDSCDISGNTNLRYSGEGNQGWIRYNTNINLGTSYCQLYLTRNINLRAYGEYNSLTAQSNTNSYFETRRARITAYSNTNLKVYGNGFTVSISNTVNHVYRGDSSSETSNKLENHLEVFSANTSVKACTDKPPEKCDPSTAGPTVTLSVINVNDTIIDGPSYGIGGLAFTMKPDQNNTIHVELQNGTIYSNAIDSNGIDSNAKDSNAIDSNVRNKRSLNSQVAVLTSTKDGNKQTLKVTGGLITRISDRAFKMTL